MSKILGFQFLFILQFDPANYLPHWEDLFEKDTPMMTTPTENLT